MEFAVSRRERTAWVTLRADNSYRDKQVSVGFLMLNYLWVGVGGALGSRVAVWLGQVAAVSLNPTKGA